MLTVVLIALRSGAMLTTVMISRTICADAEQDLLSQGPTATHCSACRVMLTCYSLAFWKSPFPEASGFQLSGMECLHVIAFKIFC